MCSPSYPIPSTFPPKCTFKKVRPQPHMFTATGPSVNRGGSTATVKARYLSSVAPVASGYFRTAAAPTAPEGADGWSCYAAAAECSNLLNRRSCRPGRMERHNEGCSHRAATTARPVSWMQEQGLRIVSGSGTVRACGRHSSFGPQPARVAIFPRVSSRLLSVQLVAPDDWLCSPVDSAADLDSIPAHAPRGSPGAKALETACVRKRGTPRVAVSVSQVHVRYEVEALFLEGVAEA